MKRHIYRWGSLLYLLTGLVLSTVAGRGQWVAFNDHAAGSGTHVNATRWNVFGTTDGAPGNSGPLQDIASGAALPVTLTITHSGASQDQYQGSAASGSPAYDVFHGYVDFQGAPNPSIAIAGTAIVTYRFSGLSPSRRYSFKGTAIRGDSSYGNRWTLFQLVGASSFVSAHTRNAYTNGLFQNQVAINTGVNHTASTGDLAVWEYIDPGADGTFDVTSRQYTGTIPGGTANGSKAYGLTGVRLEELPQTNGPVVIVTQPQSQAAIEGELAILSAGVNGYVPAYQWYRGAESMAGQTNASLVFSNVLSTDSAAYYLVVSNSFNVLTSSVATLTVYPNLAVPILAFTNAWRYNQSGLDLGSEWKEPGFDDSTWASGAGVLGYEDNSAITPLIRTPLSLYGTYGQPVLTYYFRTTFTGTNPAAWATLVTTNLIDDGVVVYLNGAEVYRLNMPEGEVRSSTLASSSIREGVFTPIYLPVTNLVSGTNVLAAEVHQRDATSTDVVFGLSLKAEPAGFGRITVLGLPAELDLPPGGTVNLRAFVNGVEPVSLQWLKNGSVLSDGGRLSGCKTDTLSIASLQYLDAGHYTLLASNIFGPCSAEIALGVNPVQFTRLSGSIVAHDNLATLGCAWGDFDGDGYQDLFVSSDSGRPLLYHNTGQGDFTDVTPASLIANSPYSECGVWGDFDNDGDLDLFTTGSRSNALCQLYRNDGGGVFTAITSPDMQQNLVGNFRAAAWADYDQDGYLDLLVVRNNATRFLYHNNQNGTLSRVANTLTLNGSDESIAWADYDNDGDLDLFIPNWAANNWLYRNDGNGVFTRITTGVIVNDGNHSRGCAWGDYDNDGYPDLFVARVEGAKNSLYHNNGNGTFTKITTGSIPNDIGVSTGCAWGDYDNDGYLDLFVCNNNGTTNFLYRNNGDSTFTRIYVCTMANDTARGHGCGWADFDNDGDLDLFVSNWFSQKNDMLYRNEGNSNGWLNVRLVGTASNRSAIGAKVRVQAMLRGRTQWQLREISGGDGCSSQQSMVAHFGLGDTAVADALRVEWPSGRVQEMREVALRQSLTIQETDLAIRANGTEAVAGSEFSLIAKGLLIPGTYQWFFGNLPLPLETNAVLLLTNIQPFQAGQYMVRVTTSNSVTFSAPLTLKVREVLRFPTEATGTLSLSDRQLRLKLAGVSTNSRTLVLESSSNLVDWSNFSTNVISSSNSYFLDWATNVPGRFYRAKELP